MKKKLIKLIESPRLFFNDMYLNRKIKIEKKIRECGKKKKLGNEKYTIITPVYNMEEYLEDYFTYMIKQKLDFEKNINLIMVDDGSTDNSKEIIKRYMNKYPNNIKYIYKKNGGQASARNVGLSQIKEGWVTFTDADDKLDCMYFKNIDNKILKNKNVKIISTNIYFYHERVKSYADNHPLKFKFHKTVNKIRIKDMNDEIQLSAASTLFRKEEIDKINIKFDERVKPNFEDAKFIIEYMEKINKESEILFLKDSIYYYRKRKEKNSTLDKSIMDKRLYNDVLRYGILELLEKKGKEERIEKYIQNTILYHLYWQIKEIINSEEKVNFLNIEEKKEYVLLIKKIMEHIDDEVIEEYNITSNNLMYKAGLLNCFKEKQIKERKYFLREVEENKKVLSFYSGKKEEKILLNKEIKIIDRKIVRKDFLGEVFIYEYFYTIETKKKNEEIEMLVEGCENIKKKILNSIKPQKAKEEYWLFIDRDIQADDNAEHLYRYVKNNHPEIKSSFVLRKDSKDWYRLEKEGFVLVDYTSRKFTEEYKRASKIISSHIDGYITNKLGKNSLKNKKYVFLQHGVIKDDLSKWLNTKKIDLMLTSTEKEYESIVGDYNKYKNTRINTALTGLPRHDSLQKLNREIKTKKEIIIMPTWRKNIVGSFINGSVRNKNKDFSSSEYAIKWKSFLKSDFLKKIKEEEGYKISFFPHSNVQMYLDEMEIPEYIEVKDHNKTTIQKLFAEAEFMITDYSSVAFEMAQIGKSTIYYQFDEKEVFNGTHTYQKGYYDYREDGFGEVVTTEKELEIAVELMIKNGIEDKYQKRINEVFKYRDENNCKRTFDRVKKI